MQHRPILIPLWLYGRDNEMKGKTLFIYEFVRSESTFSGPQILINIYFSGVGFNYLYRAGRWFTISTYYRI